MENNSLSRYERFQAEQQERIKAEQQAQEIANIQEKKRQEEIEAIYQKLLQEKGGVQLSERQENFLRSQSLMVYNEQQQQSQLKDRILGIRTESLSHNGPSLKM